MAQQQSLDNLLNEFECIEILKNYLCTKNKSNIKLNLINFHVKPIKHETLGYLGEYFLLNIIAQQDEGEKNYEFFIKTLPVSNEEHRETIKEMGIFTKEANLYRTLFKELKKYDVLKWHPDCFYARDDIIIMENLLNYNYSHLKSDELLSKNHLKSILKSLASMHGSCLVYEEKNSVNIGEKYKDHLFEPSFLPQNGWFNAGLQAIKYVASVHPKFQTASYQAFIKDKLIQSLKPMYDIVHTTQFRRVFVHRDIWNKNVFYKFNHKNSNGTNVVPTLIDDELECVFVDFQISRYQPPGMDVVLVIHLNTDRTFRESILEECFKYYYDCLNQFVGKYNVNLSSINISWEEFRKSCDFIKLPCLVLNGIYTPLTFLSCDIVNDLKMNNPEKFNEFVHCDRIELIKEQMNKNFVFRDTLLEIAEELVEYVINF